MPILSRLRSIAAVAATLIGLTGCGPNEPTVAPLVGPIATATRDGLLVTLALEHAPLFAGARAWAKVTVVNTAPVIRHDQGGGCEFLADMLGKMPARESTAYKILSFVVVLVAMGFGALVARSLFSA